MLAISEKQRDVIYRWLERSRLPYVEVKSVLQILQSLSQVEEDVEEVEEDVDDEESEE